MVIDPQTVVRHTKVYSGGAMKTKTRMSLLAGLFFFLMSIGRAQDTATIVGTVTDPSGAVVPEVRITVANPEKGLTREVASNASGEYVAPKLPIGNYLVTAEAGGFQRLVRSGITL